jgi:hypothetical protein
MNVTKLVSFVITLLLISGLFFSLKSTDNGNLKKQFVDTLDSKVDLSEFLRTRYGFAFIPTIVTEPAIGYGGGGGLLFIHRTPEEIAQGGGIFPSISAVGGIYTETKTWAVGGGHFGVSKNGNIRYRIGGGYASANLHYYRSPIFKNGIEEIGFNLKVYGGIGQVYFRLGTSDFFAGFSYSYGHSDVSFNIPIDLPEIDKKEYNQNVGGIGLIFNYDTRDNMFTPNTGMVAYFEMIYNSPYIGSTNTFQRLFTHWLGYLKLRERLYGALRLDMQSSYEDTPFYMRPYINLRGIPAMRYQGKSTWLAEGELRWDFTYRWSLVGFGGYGQAFPANKDLLEKRNGYNFGAGFRYYIARLYGIRAGIDIARGPENWAFYIQFGSSWIRY